MASSRTKQNSSSLSTWRHLPSKTPSSPQSSSAFASYTTNSFHSRCSSSVSAAASTAVYTRSTSPTRVSLYGHKNQRSQSPTIRFSIDRPTSPSRPISIKRQSQNHHHTNAVSSNQKRTCACSPTTHPGSYRCAFHKSLMRNSHSSSGHTSSYHSSSKLNFRRSAMKNSLVRIGGVEGELVKRALSALIRPSSHQLRRRTDFERRPSRLSAMSKADDLQS